MIGTSNPKELAQFYEKVFQKKPDMSDGDWSGWQIGSCFFNIGMHSEVKNNTKEPQRIILNFETKNVMEEFERIKNLGTTVIKEPYGMNSEGEITTDGEGMQIATFADPDGNYFQLMSPWESDKN